MTLSMNDREIMIGNRGQSAPDQHAVHTGEYGMSVSPERVHDDPCAQRRCDLDRHQPTSANEWIKFSRTNP